MKHDPMNRWCTRGDGGDGSADQSLNASIGFRIRKEEEDQRTVKAVFRF